jgi:hypothetical protein
MPSFPSGRTFRRARGLAAGLCVLAGACSSDSTAEPEPTPTTSTIVVDASINTAYVSLGETATLVAPPDPATSTAWDLSFFSTTIALNATAGVTAYCFCANEALTGEQVMAATATSQLSAFEARTSADVPATTAFTTDVFTAHKWYRYNITGTDNQIWPVFNTYLVKRGTAVYKVQVTSYYNAAAAPRHLTIRYARIQQ